MKISVTLLLAGLTWLLASCDGKDVMEGNNNENATTLHLGDVNITVSTLAFEEGGVLFPGTDSPGDEESRDSEPGNNTGVSSLSTAGVSADGSVVNSNNAVRIDDDLVMVAALQEDETPVTLRNVALATGTRVCIVVYSGAATYVDHSEYIASAMGVLIPVGAGLSIPTGLCRFVAYSYNSTAAMPAHSPTLTVNVTNDLLWGETTQTVSGSPFNLHITMRHLFSQVKMDASLGSGAPIIISTFNLGTAVLQSYQLPLLTIQTGVLTPGTTSNVAFTNPGPYNLPGWISATRLVYTNSVTPTSLVINNLNVNGTIYPGPYYVNYTDPLVPGKSYTLKVVFHRLRGGSADRIWLDGDKLAITRDPNVAGLFFKFGGVVGMNNLQGTFDVPTMIVYNPLTTPGAITGFGNTTPDLPGVPAMSKNDWDTWDPAAELNISIDKYHNLSNIRQGKGDPCRLIGMTLGEIASFADDVALYAREDALARTLGSDGYPIGGWRMPTPSENERFTGISNPTSVHWWNETSPNQSPWGIPPIAGGEFPQRNSNGGAPDASKFLPAAGYRNNATGNHFALSQAGAYWSNTPALNFYNSINYVTGYSIIFSTNSIASGLNITTPPLYAYTVRCVRKEQYWSMFSVSQNEWEPVTLGGGTSGQGDVKLW